MPPELVASRDLSPLQFRVLVALHDAETRYLPADDLARDLAVDERDVLRALRVLREADLVTPDDPHRPVTRAWWTCTTLGEGALARQDTPC